MASNLFRLLAFSLLINISSQHNFCNLALQIALKVVGGELTCNFALFHNKDPVAGGQELRQIGRHHHHALALRGTGSKLSAFISVFPLDRQLDNKYLREPGSETVTYKEVPFASRYVDPAVISNMEKRLPVTYSLLKNTLY